MGGTADLRWGASAAEEFAAFQNRRVKDRSNGAC